MNKLDSGKRHEKTCVRKQQMLQLFQKLDGNVATKKWSQNMLTKQAASGQQSETKYEPVIYMCKETAENGGIEGKSLRACIPGKLR